MAHDDGHCKRRFAEPDEAGASRFADPDKASAAAARVCERVMTILDGWAKDQVLRMHLSH